MRIGLHFRELLRKTSVWIEEELDRLIAGIQATWRIEHEDDGTHKAITASGGVAAAGAGAFAGAGTFEETVTVTGVSATTTLQSVRVGAGLGTSAGGTVGAGVEFRSQYSKWDVLASIASSPSEWRLDVVDRTPSGGAEIVLRINNLPGGGDYAIEPGLISTPPTFGRDSSGRRWVAHLVSAKVQTTVTFTAGPTIQAGTATPEGAVTASVGSLYLRTDGGAGTTLYVKESGSGNTGWVAK